MQSDWSTQFQPWILFARHAISAGFFPAWNPHSLDGTPFFASGQPSLLNVFSIPYLLAPLPLGYALGAWLQFVATAFGTYLLVRELRAHVAGALLAGVAYGFGAWHVMWISAPALVTPMTVLPWMLWRLECMLRSGRWRDGAWLAAACAVCFLSGHPGNSAIAAAGLVTYGAVRVLAGGVGAPWRRIVAVAAAALLVGAAISMAANLPNAALVPGSAGQQARADGGLRVPLTSVRTLFFPDWWRPYTGRQALAGTLTLDEPQNVKEITFYGGVVALILAAIGLAGRPFRRERLPLAALAYLGADLALVGPVRRVLVHLPAYSNINISRGIFLVQMAIALLAGLGLSDLVRGRVSGRRAAAFVSAAMGLALLTVLLSRPGKLLDAFAGKRPNVMHTPNSATAVAVGAFALLALATIVLITLRPRMRPALFVAAILALALLDAGRVAQLGFRYFPPGDLAFPKATPAIAWLEQHAHGRRIATPQTTLPPNTQMVYGLNSVQAYEAPEPDMKFFRLWRRITPVQPYIFPLVIAQLGQPQRQLLNVLGARFLVTPGSQTPRIQRELPPGGAAPGLAGTREVYSGRDARIFENPTAAPRVFVPRSVEAATSDANARDLVLRPSFRPPRDAIVQGGRAAAGSGAARIVREQNSQLDIRARMSRPGLVVLNDRLKDGWSVTVDGRPAKALRADAVMRGVEVPAGTHQIRWSYTVPGLRAGVLLSLLGLLTLAGWLVATRTRRSR